MKVQMKDLREHPVDLEIDISPEALELEDPEFVFPEKVKGAILFTVSGDRVLARGRVETAVEADCVRCLTRVKATVRAPVDVVYEKTSDELTPEVEIFGAGTSDERVAFFDGETIDAAGQVREAIMIELPHLPLCSEGCQGLCPKCGTNLNEGLCGCEKKNDDAPSWKSALKNMKLD